MKSGRVVYCPNVKEWQRPGRDTFQRYTHTRTASLPVKSPRTTKVGAHKSSLHDAIESHSPRGGRDDKSDNVGVVLSPASFFLRWWWCCWWSSSSSSKKGFSLGVLGRQRRCRRARCMCASPLTSSVSSGIFIVIDIVTVVEGVLRVVDDAFCCAKKKRRRRRGTTSSKFSSSSSSSSSRLRGRRVESRDWIRVRETFARIERDHRRGASRTRDCRGDV